MSMSHHDYQREARELHVKQVMTFLRDTGCIKTHAGVTFKQWLRNTVSPTALVWGGAFDFNVVAAMREEAGKVTAFGNEVCHA